MKALVLAALLAATPALADPRTLAMSGHGEVRAAPDLATINAGVASNAATAAAALAANTARMTSIFAALKKQGVADKDMQTESFSVSPQYNNPRDGGAMVLTGYQVNNQVSVHLNDVAKLGTVLDALVAAGANQMNGIGFGLRDSALMLQTARRQAIADARARAETYAQAAGVTLGPILSISEGGGEPSHPMYKTIMLTAARAVPVAAGEESVGADVSVVWEIH